MGGRLSLHALDDSLCAKQLESLVLAVLLLFLIPVGGGIPAGVLLARSNGLAWPVTAGLYLVSDVMLAFAFEPVLRGIVALGRKLPMLARISAAVTVAIDRSAVYYGGRGAGPFMLIAIAFGVDPMTGRAAALAAGHGFVAGWAIAIAGDMGYYGVIAFTTLRLNAYFQDPNTTMLIVLGAMIVVPVLVRRVRGRRGTTSQA